jgi:hypothetical protein
MAYHMLKNGWYISTLEHHIEMNRWDNAQIVSSDHEKSFELPAKMAKSLCSVRDVRYCDYDDAYRHLNHVELAKARYQLEELINPDETIIGVDPARDDSADGLQYAIYGHSKLGKSKITQASKSMIIIDDLNSNFQETIGKFIEKKITETQKNIMYTGNADGKFKEEFSRYPIWSGHDSHSRRKASSPSS